MTRKRDEMSLPGAEVPIENLNVTRNSREVGKGEPI